MLEAFSKWERLPRGSQANRERALLDETISERPKGSEAGRR